ncbi:MAG: hypothetical protein NBV67_00860 [Tagaea sp.]|nr:hypothetical protein [Tagaea sp.]
MQNANPTPPALSAGIRNRNPGNLMDHGIPWRGLIGRDAKNRCVFDTMANGVRAMALDILNDYGKDRQRTPRQLVSEYAPPNENDTLVYMGFVATAMGVGLDDDLRLRAAGGTVDRARLALLLRTKIRMECGNDQWALVEPREFEAGIADALQRVPTLQA